MADLANSCDQKCKICKFRKESWPFWLEWVVWRLDTINLSGLAKPKKSAIIFAKMADLANSCDPKCGICKFWIESWPFWLKWVVWWHHMTNVSKLAKPKKNQRVFFAKMADSAISWPLNCWKSKFRIKVSHSALNEYPHECMQVYLLKNQKS